MKIVLDICNRTTLLKVAHSMGIPRTVTRRITTLNLHYRILLENDQIVYEHEDDQFVNFMLNLLRTHHFPDLQVPIAFYILSYCYYYREIFDDIRSSIDNFHPDITSIFKKYQNKTSVDNSSFDTEYLSLFSPNDLDLLDSRLACTKFSKSTYKLICNSLQLENCEMELIRIDDDLSEDLLYFSPMYTFMIPRVEIKPILSEISNGSAIRATTYISVYPDKKRFFNRVAPYTIYLNSYRKNAECTYSVLYEFYKIPVTVETVQRPNNELDKILLGVNSTYKGNYLEKYTNMGLPPISRRSVTRMEGPYSHHSLPRQPLLPTLEEDSRETEAKLRKIYEEEAEMYREIYGNRERSRDRQRVRDIEDDEKENPDRFG